MQCTQLRPRSPGCSFPRSALRCPFGRVRCLSQLQRAYKEAADIGRRLPMAPAGGGGGGAKPTAKQREALDHKYLQFLAAFVATNVLTREIDNRTVLTVVSKPVSRPIFVLGKFLGVAGAQTIVMVFLAVLFMLVEIHGVREAVAARGVGGRTDRRPRGPGLARPVRTWLRLGRLGPGRPRLVAWVSLYRSRLLV